MRELENEMDAAELMEWVAYMQTTDDKYCEKLQTKIEIEKSEEQKTDTLRMLLQQIGTI